MTVVNFFKTSVIIFVIFHPRDIICVSVDNENAAFPEMFQMESYAECDKSRNTYCLFDFKIEPKDVKSNLWKNLENFKTDPLKLDRTILNRMICVPRLKPSDTYGLDTLKEELKDPNISIKVLSIECEKEYDFFYFKAFFYCSVLLYVALVFQCTWYHHKRNNGIIMQNSWCGRWYTTFSIIQNVQKLKEDNKNSDFQRLKCIQGIRVFNTMVVVFWHTVLSLHQLYVIDVDELEKNYENSLFFYLMFLGAFCVQTFFFISAFLLTNQIYELERKHGFFSLKHCYILMVNRFFRFLPTLLITVAATKLGLYDNSPHTVRARNMCLPVCQQYWWYTVFQINFLLTFDKICTPGLWYLSVDTAYYTLTLIILYIILKFKLSHFKVIGLAIVGVSLYFGIYIYINDFEFLFQPFPEAVKTLMQHPTIRNVYVPPMASWTSSLFGVILGYVYFNNKQINHFEWHKVLEILWWLIFTCVPPFAVYLSTFSYNGLCNAFLSATIKALFVFPLGIGILGMVFGLGGPIKTFLESRILLILSNVTYCTYVFHFFIVFAKGLFLTEMLKYKAFHMILWVLFDFVASFTLGAIFTVSVEYPGLALQKMYVPQIRKKSKI
ncbi:nose resistant to fluoxetine protein 6-like [Anthonomus grandis grandis]|uniref:nose resistant to fluoxetine protein 6-like n=1 Tax=Anthonomus grandis grandis TaxID=2921223 RepID=UPI0021664C87|nr:nose resistant to fluoxetine protein 6-like [Anthonomus grandis grandis]